MQEKSAPKVIVLQTVSRIEDFRSEVEDLKLFASYVKKMKTIRI